MDLKPVLTGIGLGKKHFTARLLRDELEQGHVQQLKEDEQVGEESELGEQVGTRVTRPQVKQ